MKPIQRGWRSSVPEASGTMLRKMLAPNSIPSDEVLTATLEGQQNNALWPNWQVGGNRSEDQQRRKLRGVSNQWVCSDPKGLYKKRGTKRGTTACFLQELTGA